MTSSGEERWAILPAVQPLLERGTYMSSFDYDPPEHIRSLLGLTLVPDEQALEDDVLACGLSIIEPPRHPRRPSVADAKRLIQDRVHQESGVSLDLLTELILGDSEALEYVRSDMEAELLQSMPTGAGIN